MSTFLWTFWGSHYLGGLDGNVYIFVEILGDLSGLGSLSGNVYIFVDFFSGLGSLSQNVHIFVDILGA